MNTDDDDKTPTHQIIIQQSKGWGNLGLRDLWEYKELFYFSIYREIQGRYRQTALGISWIFIRPLVNVLVLSLTFGIIVNVPSEGFPYPVFVMTALLPWGYFQMASLRGSNSLVDNLHVISKVYFPRMLVPLAAVFGGLIDFLASFLVLLVTLLIFNMPLRWQIITVPLFTLVVIFFALAVSLWLATLSVRYRDINFAIGFFLQALMFLSPVIYSIEMVPEVIRPLYALNPMTGVIQGFRWALLGNNDPPGILFAISVVIILVLVVSGAYVFRRTERTIVDIL